MSDHFHMHRFVVFFAGLVHPTLNSPRALMNLRGEKKPLIAHKFSNLVPEMATIVELSYSCEFSLENAQWHFNFHFSSQ